MAPNSMYDSRQNYNEGDDLISMEELRYTKDDQKLTAITDRRDKKPGNQNRWLLIYIFIPSILFKGLQRTTIPVIPEFVHRTLHGSHGDIGMIVACVGLGRLMGNLPSGWFVNYFGSYRGLVISCLWTSLAWFMACGSNSVALLALTCLMEGVGLSLWQLSRQNLVTLECPGDRRGRVQAMTGGLERFSSVFGPAVGGHVAHTIGLRAPFGIKAGLMLASAIVYLELRWLHNRTHTDERDSMPSKECLNGNEDYGAIPTNSLSSDDENDLTEEEEEPSSVNDNSNKKGWCCSNSVNGHDNMQSSNNYCSILQDNLRMLGLVSVFVVFMPIARETRLVLFPLKAMELGYGPNVIGWMMAITFVVDSSLFPLAGWLMDRYGRKYSGVPAALFLALGYGLPPLILHHQPNNHTTLILLTLISCVGGIGNGLSCGIMNAIGSDLATAAQQKNQSSSAMFLALYRIIADTGIFLGPLVGGLLAEWKSLDQAFGIIALASLIAALWLALIMPETAKHLS
mmetsp:Transcript_13998/g.20678  ORF Transcript_13998/g.20678 Transcript_13998/m.20678 type:complete len:513 (-) Transcript_13998:363-1901(-)